jgi:hypothetical protein
MINDNNIWAFLISEFNKVLKEYGYDDWVIIRNYQPSIQGLKDKTIYLHKISKRRIGTQGNTSVLDNQGNWQNIDHWYEEILFQVGAYKKIDINNDTKDTITSEDVLSILLAYINSARKVEDWKKAGYEVIKATNMRLLDYETDSGIQEKFPQFDFLLVLEQSNLKKIEKIDTIETEIKRV